MLKLIMASIAAIFLCVKSSPSYWHAYPAPLQASKQTHQAPQTGTGRMATVVLLHCTHFPSVDGIARRVSASAIVGVDYVRIVFGWPHDLVAGGHDDQGWAGSGHERADLGG